MCSSVKKLTTLADMDETLKAVQLQSLLSIFQDAQKKAERANSLEYWQLEACFLKTAASTAETIFELLGLANAQTATGKIPVSDGSC